MVSDESSYPVLGFILSPELQERDWPWSMEAPWLLSSSFPSQPLVISASVTIDSHLREACGFVTYGTLSWLD